MNVARLFDLAGRARKIAEVVGGQAHAAANAMADGPHKSRVKLAINEAESVAANLEAFVFDVLPAVLTYRSDMPEAELRAWAASLVENIHG